jgi:hypothetical protein
LKVPYEAAVVLEEGTSLVQNAFYSASPSTDGGKTLARRSSNNEINPFRSDVFGGQITNVSSDDPTILLHISAKVQPKRIARRLVNLDTGHDPEAGIVKAYIETTSARKERQRYGMFYSDACFARAGRLFACEFGLK